MRIDDLFRLSPAVLVLLSGCAQSPAGDSESLGEAESDVLIGNTTVPDWQDVDHYTPKPGSPFTSYFVDRNHPAVGILFTATGQCSGTLIGRDYFLTAAHCVGAYSNGSYGGVQFNYHNRYDANGNFVGGPQPETFTVAAVLECGDPSLGACALYPQPSSGMIRDYAVLQLSPNAAGVLPGDKYGFRHIDTPSIVIGTPIALIQHPGGIPMVVDTGEYDKWDGVNANHTADMLPGSSGAAVLDRRGKIISLNTAENQIDDNYGPALVHIVQASDVLKRPITGNTYQLVRSGSGRCLDLPNYSKATGEWIAESDCKSAIGYRANQELEFVRMSGGGFEIVGHDSQKCVDLPGSQTANGTLAQLYPCNGGNNQIWDPSPDGAAGEFRLRSRLNNAKCLYLNPGDATPRLKIADCATLSDGLRRFRFRLTPKSYMMVLDPTNQCLDMPGFTTLDTAGPQQYACKTTPDDIFNQEWIFEPRSDGAVRIRNNYSDKCLSILNGSTTNGVLVQQYACTENNEQRWYVLPQANGTFKLQNKASSKCMDYYGGAFKQFTCSTYSTQLYRLQTGVN